MDKPKRSIADDAVLVICRYYVSDFKSKASTKAFTSSLTKDLTSVIDAQQAIWKLAKTPNEGNSTVD